MCTAGYQDMQALHKVSFTCDFYAIIQQRNKTNPKNK
jgi:hypothetical protein